MRPFRSAILAVAAVLTAPLASAQDEGTTWTFDTYTPGPCSPTGAAHGGCPPGELVRIRVVTVAHGLVRPWHLSFLPGGSDMLVTELPGRLRIVRDGKLEPEPIAGWPDERLRSQDLKSVVLHPDFERNGLVYLSYTNIPSRVTAATRRSRSRGRASTGGRCGRSRTFSSPMPGAPARRRAAPKPGRTA